MAPFTQEEFRWNRLDVQALITGKGLIVIFEQNYDAYLQWLSLNQYQIDPIDCTPGLESVAPELGRILEWERQFGYTIKPGYLNLDTLNDGFNFIVPEQGGRVLELIRPDVVWDENPYWWRMLLDIAHRHSIIQLAFGKRFFTSIILPEESPLLGTEIRPVTLGCSYP